MEEQLPNATEFIADLARSIGFLSRYPVPDRFFTGHDGTISASAHTFPVAGFVIAFIPSLALFAITSIGGDPLLAASIALAIATYSTGALHEDGLADAADGLFGGRDKDHALAIMKDSRLGTYGVVALIGSFGLRATALAALVRYDPLAAALAITAAASVSRAAMVYHWHALPPAREGGVAAGAGQPDKRARTIAIVIGVAIAVVVTAPFISGVKAAIVILAAIGAGAHLTARVKHKLGGHTGDTIGATQQVSEIAMLATLALSV